MSDTQNIVDTLTKAINAIYQIRLDIVSLPYSEQIALRPAFDMLNAIDNTFDRRIAAHSNALEVS